MREPNVGPFSEGENSYTMKTPTNKSVKNNVWGGISSKILKNKAINDKDAITDSKKILSEIKKHTFKLMSSERKTVTMPRASVISGGSSQFFEK